MKVAKMEAVRPDKEALQWPRVLQDSWEEVMVAWLETVRSDQIWIDCEGRICCGLDMGYKQKADAKALSWAGSEYSFHLLIWVISKGSGGFCFVAWCFVDDVWDARQTSKWRHSGSNWTYSGVRRLILCVSLARPWYPGDPIRVKHHSRCCCEGMF